ncbi:hypothetical protein U1Q18_051649 [Sarracenia purpurea var. burkii]
MPRLASKKQATPSSPPCPADLYWPRWGSDPPTPAPRRRKNFSPSHIFGFPSDLRVSGFHPDSCAAAGFSRVGSHPRAKPCQAHGAVQQICTGQVGGVGHPPPPRASANAKIFRRGRKPRFLAIWRFWIKPRQPSSWRGFHAVTHSQAVGHFKLTPCPPDLYCDLRVLDVHPGSRAAGRVFMLQLAIRRSATRARPPVQQICTGQVGGVDPPPSLGDAKFFAEPYFPVSQRSDGFWISPRQPRGWPGFVWRFTIKLSAAPSSPPCPPDLYWSRWGSDPPTRRKNFSSVGAAPTKKFFRDTDDQRRGQQSGTGQDGRPAPPPLLSAQLHRSLSTVHQPCTSQAGLADHPPVQQTRAGQASLADHPPVQQTRAGQASASPTTHLSTRSVLAKPASPNTHLSTSSVLAKPASPTTHLSSKPVLAKPAPPPQPPTPNLVQQTRTGQLASPTPSPRHQQHTTTPPSTKPVLVKMGSHHPHPTNKMIKIVGDDRRPTTRATY